MRIVVPSNGDTLDSMVAERFARADYFIVYDDTTNEFFAIPNGGLGAHGAGPRVVQMIAREGADVIIVPGMGQNAFSAATAAGIKPYLARPGTVRQNIEWFKRGELEELTTPTRM
ncbi:MAG: NifB/NifX family molybdenum-iron cluster-binding protein [Thermotogaceae bacterium]|nr:NifB/NifX family molybdenum-iron cluster-binding protein [Thermotogaceae bacterium]